MDGTKQYGLWMPPLNFAPLGKAQGEFADFQERVLRTHIMRAEQRRGKASAEIAASDLETVEGRFKLRTAAAQRCRNLLAEARADLEKDKDRGNVPPDTNFGLTSAYRGPEYDKALWLHYFQTKYYRIKIAKFKGKFYAGEASLERIVQKVAEDMVAYIAPRKAAPGYSNHTNGIAVDLWTIEGGSKHVPESGKSDGGLALVNQAYEETWLHDWLLAHRTDYNINRIPSEAWHWEFH
jgi:hypothetical protein